jgi:hypothetical protein
MRTKAPFKPTHMLPQNHRADPDQHQPAEQFGMFPRPRADPRAEMDAEQAHDKRYRPDHRAGEQDRQAERGEHDPRRRRVDAGKPAALGL